MLKPTSFSFEINFSAFQNVNPRSKEVSQHSHIISVNHNFLRKKKTILALLACLHGILLLCTRLANDRPLSSSRTVCAEYELMHCNMTVIIPLSKPAVLHNSLSHPLQSSVFPNSLSLSPLCSPALSSLLLLTSPLSTPTRANIFSRDHLASLTLASVVQCQVCLSMPFRRCGGSTRHW